MANSVGDRPSRLRSALASLLTLLILIPAGFLFVLLWQDLEDEGNRTRLEKQGVEYLTGLAPLVSALAEAQSSALQGVSASPTSLTGASNRVAEVDQRLGESLGTRERWTGLREKIGALPGVTGNRLEVFQAHVEVTDLAMALYRAVLDNSGLSRDPDNDLAHLQTALGIDLPTTVVQVSRMGDLSLLNANITGNADQRAEAQAAIGPQFGAAVQSANAGVASLTDNLQAAVNDTGSTTLSGNLVTTVDSFRRSVEAYIRGATPSGNAPPNAAAMATAQSQLQTSLTSLAAVVIREMTGLLDDRRDRLDTRRIQILVAAGLIVLLTLIVIIVSVTGRRGGRMAPPPGAESGRDMPGGPPDEYGDGRLDPAPPHGDKIHPTRRERSGVLR